MNKIKIITLLFIVAFVFISCKSSFQSFKIEEYSKFADKDGIFYTLPKTLVNVNVKVEKTDFIKGPYSEFANRFLGISNVIDESYSNFKIYDIEVNTLSVPDENKIFFLTFPCSKRRKNDEFAVRLLENGLISDLNFPNQTTELRKDNNMKDFQIEETENIDTQFKLFLNENLIEKVDTLFEIMHVDTVKLERQILKRTSVPKTTEQKAREISEFILQLNEYRIQLLSGFQEVPYSYESLKFMINTIDQLISDYTSLFVGKSVKSTLEYRFTLTPEKNNTQGVFIFSLDKNLGLSKSPSVNNSNNVFVEFIPSLFTTKIAEIIENKNKNTNTTKGLFYNVPERTNMVIYKGNNDVLLKTDFLISQFGVVNFLPSREFKVKLHTKTGALNFLQ